MSGQDGLSVFQGLRNSPFGIHDRYSTYSRENAAMNGPFLYLGP
ncbi:hypothetical protein GGD64_008255 [Bradyrhizobium sp. CIR3A]|nr:hypothetical protein [Bradyrhizobium sp. CIR3A]